MKYRCLNPKNDRYASYGGRGIKVCDRWLDFANFREDMGERPTGKTLDRIDNDGDYEPSNCHWATPKQQQNNRRNTRFICFKGKKYTLEQASIAFNLPLKTLTARFQRKWDEERMLTTPVLSKKEQNHYFDK